MKMILMKKWQIALMLAALLALPAGAFADPDYGYGMETRGRLSDEQVDRVKVCKVFLQDVDPKTLQETVIELERTPYPEEYLQIFEAVARTYDDIVREVGVVEPHHRNGLYEKIKMNMAYLQLGGLGGGSGNNEPLYRVIRNKLKKYLSPDVLRHPGIFQPVDD